MGEKKSAPPKAPRKPAKAKQAQEAAKAPRFDDRTFLTSMGAGRSSAAFKPKEIVYRQGDPADAVYYIETGKIQLTVVSEQGKEGVIAMLGPANSSAKDASPDSPSGWPPLPLRQSRRSSGSKKPR